MKLLYITTEGFDTAGPNNQMAMVMINDFLNAGINIHLIQSRRRRMYADIPPLLQNKKGFTYDIVDRSVIDKTHFVNRYIEEAWYAFSSFRKWRKVRDADIVFLQSCPTVIYQMILLKIFCRKPIVFNIYDIFPGHANKIGIIKSNILYNTLKFIQKFTYKLSSVITVLSEDMKKKVIEQGVSVSKVRVVPAWYDDKAVREVPLENNEFMKKYSILGNKFYVQFAGTIGYVLNYKAILEAASILKSESDIEFHIIGDGNVKQKFMSEAEKKSLTNIKFFPIQPVELVPDVYSACSICIIPLPIGVIGNGVPSKAPLLMACRRVIVTSAEEDSEYYKMFNHNNIGISVPNNDYKALAEAILELYHNPDKVAVMANNAKTFGEKNYSSTINTKKFINIFNDLVKARGAI